MTKTETPMQKLTHKYRNDLTHSAPNMAIAIFMHMLILHQNQQ
jgi:hypothetical protein